MKHFLAILTALLLPMLAAAETKQVPYSSGNGNAFTISIPVKFRPGMTVQYEWYRDNVLIPGSQRLMLAGETAIAYTIPAEQAYGVNVAFHFTYCLGDGCGVWTKSPTYLISFQECEPPQASAIAGDTALCGGTEGHTYSVENQVGVFYQWSLPPGWTITSGYGTSTITVTADTTNGDIAVRAGNGCGVGATQRLAVTMNNPARPASILGGKSFCNGAADITFSVLFVPNAVYSWTLPAGWTKTAGGDSNSITCNVGAAGGAVSVWLSANGCAGAPRTQAVNVVTCPPATCSGLNSPGVISIPLCTNPGTISLYGY